MCAFERIFDNSYSLTLLAPSPLQPSIITRPDKTHLVCLGIPGRGASVAEALCSTDSNRQAETHNKAAIDYTRTSGIPAGVMRVWTVRMFFSP